MSFVDANTAQMAASSGGIHSAGAMMRTTITAADQAALASQAFHQGEGALAFQTAHSHFVTVAGKINGLLDIAGTHVGEGSQTYIIGDGSAADQMAQAAAVIPTVGI